MSDKTRTTNFNRLLRRYQTTQDERFLDLFLRRIQGIVFRHFLVRGWKHDVIEEAFQEAAISFVRYADDWDPAKGRNAMSFFFMMVYQAPVNTWQKERRRERAGFCVKNFSELSRTGSGHDDTLASIYGVEARNENGPMLDAEERRIVREAVERLSPKNKEVAQAILDAEDGRGAMVSVREKTGLAARPFNTRKADIRRELSQLPTIQRLLDVEPEPPVVRGRPRVRPQVVKGPRLTERQVEIVRLIHEKNVSFSVAGRMLGLRRTAVRYNWKSALKKVAKSKELQEQTDIRPGMYGI